MADIKERIKNIGSFFKEMQVTQVDEANVIYVVVRFPKRWVIDDSVQERYDVSVMDGPDGGGEYYFCADISVGFDAVFDAIDFCVQANKDAMERAQIFQEKINRLKEIFGDEENSVESLRNLDFTFQKPRKRTTAKKKTPVDEVADKEIDNNQEE